MRVLAVLSVLLFVYHFTLMEKCWSRALNGDARTVVAPDENKPRDPADVCMPDASGFDRFLEKVKWETFGGGTFCIWCWSDPPWAGSGGHSQPYSNMVESQVTIRGSSSGNNCNTPDGSWPTNDAGAHALNLSGLPDGDYVVRINVDGYTYRTEHFKGTTAKAQPFYALRVQDKDAGQSRIAYDPPKMTKDETAEKKFSWDGCIPIKVSKGFPSRIVSDVVISYSVPGGGSDEAVYQAAKHRTYLMGILPKDEFRSEYTTEEREKIVRNLFLAAFEREPDDEGRKLQSSLTRTNIGELAKIVADSQEFKDHNGSKDPSEILQNLYKALLKRDLDDKGRDAWLTMLREHDWAYVIEGILTSPEFEQKLTSQNYY